MTDFVWAGSPEADRYRLEVAAEPAFDSILAFFETSEESFRLAAELALEPGEYYWRVHTIVNDESVNTSMPLLFVLASPEAVYVDAGNTAGPHLGLPGAPFQALDNALQAAGQLGIHEIRLAAGDYQADFSHTPLDVDLYGGFSPETWEVTGTYWSERTSLISAVNGSVQIVSVSGRKITGIEFAIDTEVYAEWPGSGVFTDSWVGNLTVDNCPGVINGSLVTAERIRFSSCSTYRFEDFAGKTDLVIEPGARPPIVQIIDSDIRSLIMPDQLERLEVRNSSVYSRVMVGGPLLSARPGTSAGVLTSENSLAFAAEEITINASFVHFPHQSELSAQQISVSDSTLRCGLGGEIAFFGENINISDSLIRMAAVRWAGQSGSFTNNMLFGSYLIIEADSAALIRNNYLDLAPFLLEANDPGFGFIVKGQAGIKDNLIAFWSGTNSYIPYTIHVAETGSIHTLTNNILMTGSSGYILTADEQELTLPAQLNQADLVTGLGAETAADNTTIAERSEVLPAHCFPASLSLYLPCSFVPNSPVDRDDSGDWTPGDVGPDYGLLAERAPYYH